MNLPTWATPLDIARTHATPICDCDNRFYAVASVEVTLTLPTFIAGTPAANRTRDKRTFTYDLCPVCLVYEMELREELIYRHAESITAAIAPIYEVAGCGHTEEQAETINGSAKAAALDPLKTEKERLRQRAKNLMYQQKRRAAKVAAA